MDPQASAMEQLLSMQGGATATGLGVGGANAAALAADPIALQQYRQHLLLSQSALSPFMMGGGGLDPRLLGFGQQVRTSKTPFCIEFACMKECNISWVLLILPALTLPL